MGAQQIAMPTATTEQKTSWEAGGFPDRKETLPTVHYRVRKRPKYLIQNLPPYICTTDLS